MRSLALTLLALVACGDDGVHHLADAPPGPIDAPVADAPTSGPVTLTITQGGVPRADVDVYFQNANSSLVAKVLTGADGKASAVMEPGGFVTAINPFNVLTGIALNADLRTFAGVKPGDELQLTQERGLGTSIAVTFTAPIDGAALYYYLSSSCSSQTSLFTQNTNVSGEVFMYDCGGTADVLVYTEDANGQPLGYVYKPGVAVTDGGTVDFTDAYVAIPDSTFTYTNAPAALTGFELEHQQATTRGLAFSDYIFGNLTTGTGSITVKVPPITGATAINRSTFYPWSNNGSQHLVTWGPRAATTTIDVGAGLLPEYLTVPAYAAGTRSFAWTAGSAPNTPDLVIGELSASRTDANAVTTYWDWKIAAPYSATSVVLPELPTDVAQFNILATDTAEIYQLRTAKLPGGYDAVRETALDSSWPPDVVVGATGQLVYEDLQIQQPVRTAPPVRVHGRPEFSSVR